MFEDFGQESSGAIIQVRSAAESIVSMAGITEFDCSQERSGRAGLLLPRSETQSGTRGAPSLANAPSDNPFQMPVPAFAASPDAGNGATDALSVLNSVFGLPAFRGAQEQIVRHVTDGGNCLVLMPTGGGKSLCYQLPSLLREGCGIVVSPLIALMRDQVAGLLEAGVK
ncbi:MAG: DEAD/DEAH box helicase, partial [Rudaea sp.]|nr:DEAD/DEAH box helicase [Rudaea sp.]